MNEEEAIKIIDKSWLFTTNHVLDDENKKFKMAIKTVYSFRDYEIKTILTHEQYEQNCFRMEENNEII